MIIFHRIFAAFLATIMSITLIGVAIGITWLIVKVGAPAIISACAFILIWISIYYFMFVKKGER